MPQIKSHSVFPARIVDGAIWMGCIFDHQDADNFKPRSRVVKEPLVANCHVTHKVAGLVIAHAVPFFASVSLGNKIIPTKDVRLGFE